MITIPKSVAVAISACLMSVTGVVAQGNTDASNLRSEGGAGGSQAHIVQVGAGTAGAVTTGSSGPDQDAGGAAGELPPLPSAALCADYQGQPAYQSCLTLVLAE